MTVLGALQKAAIRLIGKKPDTFFSSGNTFELELQDLANEVAIDIAKSYDWRSLTVLNQFQGDGVQSSFPMPDDYDRMTISGDVHAKSWNTWRYNRAYSLDQWLDFQNGLAQVSPGSWIILDGTMQFSPPITSGEQAQFYYISKNVVRSANGALKQEFTLDDDVFRLDERLLTLGVIWKWREQKRLDYSGDKENFDLALDEATGRERGARILRIGSTGFGPFPFSGW